MTALAPATSVAHPPSRWVHAGLAASLAVAGITHCLLMPDHFAESTIFGLGFLAAGVAQLGLAGLVALRPGRIVYAAVVALSLTLMSLYAINVLVGLPFHGSADGAVVGEAHGDDGAAHDDETTPEETDDGAAHEETDGPAARADEDGHGEAGLVLGAGEPVDAVGAGTQVAQLAAIGFASVALRRSSRTRQGTP